MFQLGLLSLLILPKDAEANRFAKRKVGKVVYKIKIVQPSSTYTAVKGQKGLYEEQRCQFSSYEFEISAYGKLRGLMPNSVKEKLKACPVPGKDTEGISLLKLNPSGFQPSLTLIYELPLQTRSSPYKINKKMDIQLEQGRWENHMMGDRATFSLKNKADYLNLIVHQSDILLQDMLEPMLAEAPSQYRHFQSQLNGSTNNIEIELYSFPDAANYRCIGDTNRMKCTFEGEMEYSLTWFVYD